MDQFGVSEVDCFTEPSAVAPDAGANFRIKKGAPQRKLDKTLCGSLAKK